MADRYGHESLLVLGLNAFAIACMGIVLSRNLTEAILARYICECTSLIHTLQRRISQSHMDETCS